MQMLHVQVTEEAFEVEGNTSPTESRAVKSASNDELTVLVVPL
jgi:hypothetical protein